MYSIKELEAELKSIEGIELMNAERVIHRLEKEFEKEKEQ